MPLFLPNGTSAKNIDKIMLLAMWARTLEQNTDCKVIQAGMGKPTFPLTQHTINAVLDYWTKVSLKSQQALTMFKNNNNAQVRTQIAKMNACIDYGDPQGDLEARQKMTQALNRWYGEKVDIKSENILFTVGGAGGLHSVFNVLNRQYPHGIIVTPFPHYTLYTGSHQQNRLFPINVMQEKGYRLTAELLDQSLKTATEQAQKEQTRVSALLLCDPNNPLGTAMNQKELCEIAEVLKNYPDIFIVLDEAYAEMRWTEPRKLSLLSVAPDLKSRIILLRSATKALSAAGERMAITLTFNQHFMSDLTQEIVNTYGHAPRSQQHIYAALLDNLNDQELDDLKNYYHPQVEYAIKRLKAMNAYLSDSDYISDSTFYVVANLRELYSQNIPSEAECVLGKCTNKKISTDEELVYSLLFEEHILVAPLSYFGISEKLGYVRITCSSGEAELEELFNRLEKRLTLVRNRDKTSTFFHQNQHFIPQPHYAPTTLHSKL